MILIEHSHVWPFIRVHTDALDKRDDPPRLLPGEIAMQGQAGDRGNQYTNGRGSTVATSEKPEVGNPDRVIGHNQLKQSKRPLAGRATTPFQLSHSNEERVYEKVYCWYGY